MPYRTSEKRIAALRVRPAIAVKNGFPPKAFETTREALSSGDTGNIKQATDEMMRKVLVETEEIKLQRANLISKFDIDTRSGLLRRLLTKS